jgi:hypothetical protein
VALNRIYITQEEIARSMYRRRKEDGFTTDDLMRLHWERQGKRAKAWAREIIKRMRKQGRIVTVASEEGVEGDRRKVLYAFTHDVLKQWGLVE